ncbi:MAG: ferredoxin [Actinobacteria bacterium]|nr:ferredoxin [Actinomycetota bacterium]
MTVEVDKKKCIGCGLCTTIASEIFKMGNDGFASVKDKNADKKFAGKAKEAADSCPTQAIKIK